MANIELFCSIQEKVCLCAVDEARRNLSYASLQNFRVKHRAVRFGEPSLVWRSVERGSAVLVWVASGLDGLITAMGVASSVLRHRADLGRWWERRDGTLDGDHFYVTERQTDCLPTIEYVN